MQLEHFAGKYVTDKSCEYLRNYDKYFCQLRNEPITLLELGIFKGGSLQLWSDYFQSGKIIGVDIDEAKIPLNNNRIETYQGYQQDTNFLDMVVQKAAPQGFDIIIDDASHIGEFTKISFWHLFNNYLKPNGIYIIEDWRTGYWSKWVDGYQYVIPRADLRIKSKLRDLISYSKNLAIKNMNNGIAKSKIAYFADMLNIVTCRKRFHSHDYGMVGFVKELIDELGMDMITCPERGAKGPQTNPKFKSIEIFPGQVFIIKSDI